MSAFTQKKSQVESRLASRTSERRSLLTGIGRTLVESGALEAAPPFAEPLKTAEEAKRQIQELTATRERIDSVVERLSRIQEKHDEIAARQKEIDNELEPHYRTIGENAFRVFRDNPLVDQEYAEIFTPVLDVNEEIRQIKRDIEKADAEMAEKAFLEKMVVRGRLIVLKNRLAIKEGQLRRLSTDAGKQIAATDFITTIGDPELDEAARPFLDLMDDSRRIAGEARALENEREALASELDSLGVERRPDARVAEIEKEIATVGATRDDALARIAESYRESDVERGEVASMLAELESLESDIEADRQLVRRLDAAIRTERVQNEIDQLESQISRKQSQVKSIETEIGTLDARRRELKDEEARLKSERGSLDDLVN